jgi:hypothetical protein
MAVRKNKKKIFMGRRCYGGYSKGGWAENGHTPSVTRKLSALPPVPAPKRHLGVIRIETPRNGRLPPGLPLTVGVHAPPQGVMRAFSRNDPVTAAQQIDPARFVRICLKTYPFK